MLSELKTFWYAHTAAFGGRRVTGLLLVTENHKLEIGDGVLVGEWQREMLGRSNTIGSITMTAGLSRTKQD